LDSNKDVRLMFRVCSLWFSNSNSKQVNKLLQPKLKLIAAHKFLPLVYQIVSRLNQSTDARAQQFQAVLEALVMRLGKEYPHHCLCQLFALSATDNSAKSSSASRILSTLEGTQIRAIVKQLRVVIREYMMLANLDVSQYKNNRKLGLKVALPRSMTALRNQSHVAVLTANLNNRLGKPQALVSIPSIAHFENDFSLVGGVNMPKTIICVGSDGVRYKQLVKGKDDLRQDAVMQQMFSVVSVLLAQNEETRKRRLNVRTYKVVPLSPRSGVLEWVQNTIPLGDYLVGQPTYVDMHRRQHCAKLCAVVCCY
jgi:serine-protein kinase ATM